MRGLEKWATAGMPRLVTRIRRSSPIGRARAHRVKFGKRRNARRKRTTGLLACAAIPKVESQMDLESLYRWISPQAAFVEWARLVDRPRVDRNEVRFSEPAGTRRASNGPRFPDVTVCGGSP